MRRIVEDLRPAAVDELGLEGALAELAARLSVPGDTRVQLYTAALPALSAALEVAAYRIVGEAVTNAVRHARACTVDVTIETSPYAIQLRISDDGTGFDPADIHPGVGLSSMRDRATEIGGSLQLRSSTAGTIVRVVLPRHPGEPPCE